MSDEKLPTGITKRGSSYLVQASKNRKRLYATCNSLAEAVVKKGELTAALLRGGEALEAAIAAKEGRRVWTLKEAFDCTLANSWRGTRSEAKVKMSVGHLLAFFGGDTKLTDITRERWDDFVQDQYKQGKTGATINRKMAALSKMLKEATKRASTSGYTRGNLPHFDRQPESKGRLRWITDKEEATLLTYATAWAMLDHHDVVTVLVDTGMRLGELFEVKPQDIDIKRNVLMIYGKEGFGTKNGDFRSIPMTSRVKAIMQRRIETHPVKVFPYNAEWLYRFWDRARELMGLSGDPQFVPHVLRHTCATRLVQRGAPITFVQKWLGHKTITMTMRYAKLAPDDLQKVVSLLEHQQAAE